MEDGNVEIHFVKTTNQLADIFTKPLDEKSFVRILTGLGMIEASSVPRLISKEWKDGVEEKCWFRGNC